MKKKSQNKLHTKVKIVFARASGNAPINIGLSQNIFRFYFCVWCVHFVRIFAAVEIFHFFPFRYRDFLLSIFRCVCVSARVFFSSMFCCRPNDQIVCKVYFVLILRVYNEWKMKGKKLRYEKKINNNATAKRMKQKQQQHEKKKWWVNDLPSSKYTPSTLAAIWSFVQKEIQSQICCWCICTLSVCALG